jgi:hypothetical protein
MSRWLPSPYALFAIVVAALLGTLSAVRGPVDADYWWHVTVGRLIVESASVPSTDPFSFTWLGQPWTPHEWLGEVLLYLSVSGLGIGLTGFLFGLLSAAGPLLAGAAMIRLGLPNRAVMLAVTPAAVVLLPYATMRPQVFTWMLLGGLVAGLVLLRPDSRRWIWLLPVVFLLWANLHGMYVIGLGVLAAYALFTLTGHTPMAPHRGLVASVLLVSLLATMATPAGPAGLLYPLRYIEPGDWGLLHIAEWQPPRVDDARNIGLALVIVSIVVTRLRKAPRWLALTAVLGVVGALLAVRNSPLAAVAAVPALAHGWATLLPAPQPHSERMALQRRFIETVVAGVLVVAIGVVVPGIRGLSGDSVVPRQFPVAATDALVEQEPAANVLTEYGWGGYLIYRTHDLGGHVFVDGRNDMYDEQILDDYLRIRNAQDFWPALLLRYRVQAILLPPSAPIIDAALDNGWCERHRDDVAVLIMGSCHGEPGAPP